MTDDETPRSALEIAMARLKKQDAERGDAEPAVTDDQRARIAEVRQAAQAKLAQEDIMFKASVATTWDPEQRATLEANHRRDLQRIQDDRDAKIEKIRKG